MLTANWLLNGMLFARVGNCVKLLKYFTLSVSLFCRLNFRIIVVSPTSFKIISELFLPEACSIFVAETPVGRFIVPPGEKRIDHKVVIQSRVFDTIVRTNVV